MKIFPLFIPNAGCPHQCFFCAQDKTTSFTEIVDESAVCSALDKLLPHQGNGEIAFYGGTFTMLPKRLRRVYLNCAVEFIESGRAAAVRISTRPDALPPDILEELYSARVTTIEIGCQSLNDKVLKMAGRGHTADDCCQAIKSCLDSGFTVGVQLMPGLPGDSSTTAMTSLQRVLEQKPDYMRFYPAVVIAGTELAKQWQAGRYTPWSLEYAVDACARLFLSCYHAGVKVIRMGLHNDPQLQKNLLAGPYHPAFGQLVRSRLWQNLLMKAWQSGNEFIVNPDDYSDLVGHCGENRVWLAENSIDCKLSLDPSVKRGMLSVSGQNLSLYE